MSNAQNVTDFELRSILDNTDKPVFIDFWAEWCGPCRMVAPIVNELSVEYTDITFVKVDIDQNKEFATMYGVRSIPTFIVIKNNDLIMRHSGATPKSFLVTKLNSLLN